MSILLVIQIKKQMKKLFFINFVTPNGLPNSPASINSSKVSYCFSKDGKVNVVFFDGSKRLSSDSLSDIGNGLGLVSIGNVIKINQTTSSLGEVFVNTDYINSIYEQAGNTIVEIGVSNEVSVSFETEKTIQEIQIESLTVFGSNAVQVFDNLSANGTTISTTSVMSYGVNSFSTASGTAYATKLPQPETGRKSTIINNTGFTLLVFPSNVGGTINNLGASNPIVIPSDGVAYEFTCVENPNPGAWIVTPPATAQLDLGEITVATVSSGTRSISIADSSFFGVTTGVSSDAEWSEDGTNKPPLFSSVQSGQTYYVNNPVQQINGITKVKVYTNLSSTQNIAGNSAVLVRLVYSGQFTQYTVGSTATSDIVQSGQGVVGNPMIGIFGGNGQWTLSNSIGASSQAFAETSTNVGDAGTRWGEFNYGTAFLSNPSFSRLGTFYIGQLPELGTTSGTLYDTYYTGVFYVALTFNNFAEDISNFKARVFVEYN
jgi:hypothetical protein